MIDRIEKFMNSKYGEVLFVLIMLMMGIQL